MGNNSSKSNLSDIDNTSQTIKKEKKKGGVFGCLVPGKRNRDNIKKTLDDCITPAPPVVLPPKPTEPTTVQDYEKILTDRMKNQLVKDPQAFLLNQLMLSTQFFGNYQREKVETINEMNNHEMELSTKLSKHAKSLIEIDRIQAAVDKRVRYLAKYGPIKGRLLPLDTKSVYIVCDNIEVSRADELYGILPDPSVYKVIMEDHNDQARLRHRRISYKGYVKLRSMDFYDKLSREERSSGVGSSTTSNIIVNETDGVKLSNDDESFECASMYSLDAKSVKSLRGMRDIYGKGVCIVNGLPFSASNSNETSRGSSEYDYAYITALSSHKPFVTFVNPSLENLSTTVIPANCITDFVIEDEASQGYESDNEDSDNVDAMEKDSESTLKDEPIYQLETQPYLNSNEFFKYFSNIFRAHLGPELGFSDRNFDKATYKGATICITDEKSSYEVTPAIACPWPNEAHEWDKRMREAIVNPNTKQTFQWPTQDMINKVMEFGCHVIPVGFAPKRGKNLDREIEWKIVFPLAERYLEQNFNHAQAKILMILKALLRAFVDPYLENGDNMFTKEHLRAFMFWQCEENPAAWNEDFLGEKLLKVLVALLHRIQSQSLPDYFLPKRNLFENVPERNLIQIQTRIARICERPTNHLLIVMRDLKFRGTFYPKMRYMKIYDALIIQDPLVKLNPVFDTGMIQQSGEVKEKKENTENKKPNSRRPSEAVGSMADIHKLTLEQPRERLTKNTKKMRTSPNQYERTKVASPPVPKPEPGEPIELKLNLCKKLEPARQRLLFDLFIPHFIEVSQFALKDEEAIQVAQITIGQAERLSRIFYEQDDKAEKYLHDIQPIKKCIDLLIRQRKQQGPNVPRRGSLTGPTPNVNRPRGLGSRTSSMIEDPYVNLNKVMNAVSIKEEDEDGKGTLTAKRPKQRPTTQQVMITAQIHTVVEKQHITAEDIIENAFKRHGIPQSKQLSEDVRIRA